MYITTGHLITRSKVRRHTNCHRPKRQHLIQLSTVHKHAPVFNHEKLTLLCSWKSSLIWSQHRLVGWFFDVLLFTNCSCDDERLYGATMCLCDIVFFNISIGSLPSFIPLLLCQHHIHGSKCSKHLYCPLRLLMTLWWILSFTFSSLY